MIIIAILSALLLCGLASAFICWAFVRVGSRHPDGVINCPYCGKEAHKFLLCSDGGYSVYKIQCPYCGLASNRVTKEEKEEKGE